MRVLLLLFGVIDLAAASLRGAAAKDTTATATATTSSERLAGYKKKNPTISSLPNHEHFQELFPHKARKLIRDADNQEICFVDRGRQYLASADYHLDPFKANNDRGDWGKCLPEELFGIMW